MYISKLTRIPIAALLGGDLESFSIAERLSWMKGRKTKKREDRIYYLLGIFGVSIPMTYGIGIKSARSRLIKAIGRKLWSEEGDDSSESIIADDQSDEDDSDESDDQCDEDESNESDEDYQNNNKDTHAGSQSLYELGAAYRCRPTMTSPYETNATYPYGITAAYPYGATATYPYGTSTAYSYGATAAHPSGR
jgi:hypothetical protein